MSMLVPLETLVGGAEATNPTTLQALAIFLGFPALAFAIIALLGKASSLARAGRGRSTEVADPIWLGSAPPSKELTSAGSMPARDTGGASARW